VEDKGDAHMPVYSHIQIPNAILKKFRNHDTGKVWHLDLEEKKIKSCSSNKLGVEYAYYSDAMEQYLNKTVEHPFSQLASSVQKFVVNNQSHIEMPLSVEDTCKKYISAAMYRSELALNELLQNSITAPFCSDQENHDDLVFFGLRHNNGMFPQLANYKMFVLVNQTKMNFVVPRNCFYEVSWHKVKCIVAPISPICALCLAPGNYCREIIEYKDSRLAFFDNHNDIYISNTHALQYEYIFNHSFIAAANKVELEDLMLYLEQHETELEKLRADAKNYESC